MSKFKIGDRVREIIIEEFKDLDIEIEVRYL